MDQSILVSVIMPVYNPGKYLRISLDMILSQTYCNWELICIDDASTDSSYKILQTYADQDNRIRVYANQENRGAAKSRNRGMELAKGDYILFVDADDAFEAELIEKVMAVAKMQQPDMVYLNYDVFQDCDLPITDNRHVYYFLSKSLGAYSRIQDCPKEMICDMQQAPYSRLYKKEFIVKNKLQFQNLKSSNDLYFGLMAAFLSQKIAHTEEYVNLIHVRDHGSAFRISNNRNPFDNFYAYHYLMKEMQKKGIWEDYGIIVQEKFLRDIYFELSTSKVALSKSYYSFLKIKGMDQMLIKNSFNCRKLSSACCRIIELLKMENYVNMLESYDKTDWFSILIEENEERIRSLFFELRRIGKRCAIWGAGKNGSFLAKFCAERGCYFEGLIDNDTEKTNRRLYGYKVYKPQEIIQKIDFIIIVNQNHFNEIYDQISKICIKVNLFSLDLYLRYKMGLEKSSDIASL